MEGEMKIKDQPCHRFIYAILYAMFLKILSCFLLKLMRTPFSPPLLPPSPNPHS